ncbi:MAG: hypothetical protein JXA74_01060 [Anaerolineae bacterium]|nr:hypothetical protein [Anaerolineae bacterium]
MPMKQVVAALVIFAHDLFTVIWVGGLITMALVLLPAIKSSLGLKPEARKLLAAIQSRLRVMIYVSMAGLVLSGVLLSRRASQFLGAFSFGNPYSAALAIKHLLVTAMGAIALYRSLALGRAQGAPRPDRERLGAVLLVLNAALGVLVLLLSAFSAALASVPPIA